MIKTIVFRLIAKTYGFCKTIYYAERYNKYKVIYDIHPSFQFNGEEILFYGGGEIIAGQNSYIGSYSTLQSTKNNCIKIGEFCSISHNVRMYTESNDPHQFFTDSPDRVKKSGNIIIGNGTWIGANVFINPGITIGENSVIGANSVVTKDILPNSIYGGVPARLIKEKSSRV